MVLIVGLGNPGKQYQNTRHNLGFRVIDELINNYQLRITNSEKFNSQFVTRNSQFILMRPQTFINTSGVAVAKAANFYQIETENIWVIHDDVDLPPRKIRIQLGGGGAGHRGILSIMDKLGTNQFVRFRLGIGHPRDSITADLPVEEYVLQKANPSLTKKLVEKAARAVIFALEHGLDKAMNHYNSQFAISN